MTLGGTAQQLAPGHPLQGSFESEAHAEWWLKYGWTYEPVSKGQQDFPNIEEIQPLAGAPALNGSTFSPDGFNPGYYAIRPEAEKPTIYSLGDRGTVMFLPLNRVNILYERHKINLSATENRSK
jgi:hypothetical protein